MNIKKIMERISS